MQTAGSITAALSDCPILDEFDFSERETEELHNLWEDFGRIDFIRGLDIHDDTMEWLEDCDDKGLLFHLWANNEGEWLDPDFRDDADNISRNDIAKTIREIRRAQKN
jgi:hypothetical protein